MHETSNADRTGEWGQSTGAAAFAFAFCVFVAGTLNLIGVSAPIVSVVFLVVVVLAYCAIGLASGTTRVAEFDRGARAVPAMYAGLATAAVWSGAAFLMLPGLIATTGFAGLAYPIGLFGGIVLMGALIVPPLRTSGAITIPGFLGERFGSRTVRQVALFLVCICSFGLLLAQVELAGMLGGAVFGMDASTCRYAFATIVVLCAISGGMRGLTRLHAIQYLVLVFSLLFALVWITTSRTGNPIPYLAQGQALTMLPSWRVDADFDGAGFVVLTFCLMAGTASLPHLVAALLTTRSRRSARRAAAWGALFAGLLASIVPIYAIFFAWEADSVAQAGINADWLPFALVKMMGLPDYVSSLVTAAALSALVAAGSALAVTIATALGHDLMHPATGAAGSRLLLGFRLMLFALLGGAAYLLSSWRIGAFDLVTGSLAIAAAGLFPVLVLGIWWKGATAWGAAAGMLSGAAISAYYVVATRFAPLHFLDMWGAETWLSVEPASAAAFGLPVGFLAIAFISLASGGPPLYQRQIVDLLHQARTVQDADGAA